MLSGTHGLKRWSLKTHFSFPLAMLIILSIVLLVVPAHAENEDRIVTLHYSSFDGGGYSYSVQVMDENILSADLRYDYGGQSHELEEGSHFDVLITLTAVQPGETNVVIRWESPILPPGESHYIVSIADDLTVTLEELNGNEIYHDLMEPLPSAPERVGHVNAGDIMLFGDSCVVIFYKSFDTPYSYTRIGNIADAEGLAAAIDGQSAYVTFEKMED